MVMATTAPPMSAIDIGTSSSFPIRLGASILRPTESKTYSSVRYNHKPQTKGVEQSSLTSSKDGAPQLSLQHGNEAYSYEGRTVDDSDRYVLLSKGSGKDKELVLEKLGSSHDFNLTSTPSETDADKLAEKFKRLQPDDADGDGLFGDDEEDDEPVDANNPFDFRNHLRPKTAEQRPSGADTPQSAAATPRPAQRAATSTPLAQPKKAAATSTAAQKKRKAQEPLKPNPKRVKAGTEPPPPPVSNSRPKPKDVPSVRIDRKASVRRPSFDDSGELILENETPVNEKPPRAPGAMALALSGQLGQGPISLRSAASSPASRNASPMPPRPEGIESPAQFDLGESSPETSAKKPRAQSPGDYFSNAEEEQDDEEDADADVEDLELPSPRQRRKSVVNPAGGGGGSGAGDEDYDMERELELALAQDDGAMAQPTVLHESDEESEEE